MSGDLPPDADDADRAIRRAIESVLEQIPDAAADEPPPDGRGSLQPWAEVAAPPGKNKRPLDELLADYAARVAADPDARAAAPSGRHPAAAFLDRFGPARRERGAGGGAEQQGSEGGRRRRWSSRRRRGRGGGSAPAPESEASASATRPAAPPRRRGGRPGAGREANRPSETAPAGQEADRSGRRRRRRRGGRGQRPPAE